MKRGRARRGRGRRRCPRRRASCKRRRRNFVALARACSIAGMGQRTRAACIAKARLGPRNQDSHEGATRPVVVARVGSVSGRCWDPRRMNRRDRPVASSARRASIFRVLTSRQKAAVVWVLCPYSVYQLSPPPGRDLSSRNGTSWLQPRLVTYPCLFQSPTSAMRRWGSDSTVPGRTAIRFLLQCSCTS